MARTLLPIFALAIASAVAGCGNTECDSIARAYAAAIAQARSCDPRAASPCGDIRRASLDSGSNACDVVAIDAAKKQLVDDLLARFISEQCPLGPSQPCPIVDPSSFECRADAQGGGTCARK
jgi:hypothetical protein